MDIQIQTVLLQSLQDIALAVIPIVGGFIVNFVKKHTTAKQLQTVNNIVKIGVTYASTLDIPNSDKYATALATAKSFASKYGIKYSDEQWKNLIEAVYAESKKDLQEITTPDTPVVIPEVSTPSTDITPIPTPVPTVGPTDVSSIIASVVQYANGESQKILDEAQKTAKQQNRKRMILLHK